MIHCLRRTQEACKVAGLKAFVVIVDFKKAFDSPPRSALWECLEWSGCPPDLLSVLMALHQDPRGKLSGSNTFFRVMRGVRQGCVLGPTLFINVLEYCLSIAGDEGTGIKMHCVPKPHLTLPPDLQGTVFCNGRGAYTDQVYIAGVCSDLLSAALDKVQAVCGAVGLDISSDKTDWMYLNNLCPDELAACDVKRSTGDKCCERV